MEAGMELLTGLTADLPEITLSVSLVIAVLFMLTPLLKKRYVAKWRCWVWLILAVRLIIPVNFTLPDTPLHVQVPVAGATIKLPAVRGGEKAAYLQPAALTSPEASGTAAGRETPVTPPTVAGTGITAAKLLSLLWLAGLVLSCFRQLAVYGHFRRFVRRWSKPVTVLPALALLANLKQELGIASAVGLRLCPQVGGPMMIGLFRPIILLPREDYADNELFFILKHELVHQKRHDLIYKLFLLAAQTIHWFNPLVRLMVRQADRDLEISCDDAVLAGLGREERARYSDTILTAMRSKPPKVTAFSTYFFGGTKAMKERLRNIFDTGRKRRGLAALLALVIVLSSAGGLIACSAGQNKPAIEVAVTLQDLTEAEYLKVGTGGEIANPTIHDFKKLTVRLDARGIQDRKISFPTMSDIQTRLTADVYWFGRSESQDNSSEDHAYYLVETTLYTRNITTEQIRDKLSSLQISLSSTDKQGNKVEKTYNLGDCLVADTSKSSPGLPDSYAEKLYQYRGTYTGDNTRIGAIIQALTYTNVPVKSFELKTDSEPYGITVNYQVDSRANYRRSPEAIETAWNKNAAVMFSLIPNAAEISFRLYDAYGDFAGAYYNRENLSDRYGMEYFTAAKVQTAAGSPDSFAAYLNQVAAVKNMEDFYSEGQKQSRERDKQIYAVIGDDREITTNSGMGFPVTITDAFAANPPVKELAGQKELLAQYKGKQIEFLTYAINNFKTNAGTFYLFAFDGTKLIASVDLKTAAAEQNVAKTLSAFQ
jgi:beta-lactamase regulating signal transducer with metallopeptidase domain